MPVYQVHRLRDTARQQFRWAPHTSGLTIVKPKDYETDIQVEGETPYEIWMALKGTDSALHIGDMLETNGELRIFKYIGFEEARWYTPEPVHAVSTGAPVNEVT